MAYSNQDAAMAKKHFGITSKEGFIKGVAQEVIQSGNYTYVKIQTLDSEVWAATYKFKPAIGDLLRFKPTEPMTSFKSKSLDRTFPTIYFVESMEVGKQGKAN